MYAPDELLQIVKEERKAKRHRYNAEKRRRPSKPIRLNKAKRIPLPDSFIHPHHNSTAHDPCDIEISVHGIGEIMPPRRSDGCVFLPRIE